MHLLKIRFNPSNNMILERAFDELVQKVRREKFVDVSTGKVVCEWLKGMMLDYSMRSNHSSEGVPQHWRQHQNYPRSRQHQNYLPMCRSDHEYDGVLGNEDQKALRNTW